MASSSSSRPGVAAAPRTSTVTRSMARRSLAPVAEDDTSARARAVEYSTRMRAAAKEPPSAGPVRSRTTADLATSASLTRTRSSVSLAARSAGSTAPTKLGAPQLTASRSRRVLAETNATTSSSNRTTSIASNSATLARSRTTAAIASASASRRYSRAEASRMTGMGVVRTGPAVQGQRPSPRKSASSATLARDAVGAGSTSDPFSTSFVRPTFDFEIRDDRELWTMPRSVSMTRSEEPRATTSTVEPSILHTHVGEEAGLHESSDEVASSRGIFALTSPSKSLAARTPLMALSPCANVFSSFGDHTPIAMDVDEGVRAVPVADAAVPRLAMRRPFPGASAVSPRALAPRAPLTRKLDEIDSESEEDDIDFLSPRKKAAKRIHLSAPSPVAAGGSTPRPFAPRAISADEDTTIHAPILPRSPPPKKRALGPTGPAGPSAPVAKSMPTSVPMQRGGRAFPLPSLIAPVSSNMPPPRLPLASTSAAMLPPLVMPRARAPAPVYAVEHSGLPTSEPRERRPARLVAPVGTTGATPASNRPTRPAESDSIPSAPVWAQVADNGKSPSTTPSRMTVADAATAEADADVSMSSTADASTVSTVSATSTTSSRSEETARRLANLQNMLSRLQMPKPSAPHGRRTSSESAPAPSAMSTVSSSRDYNVPLAPAHEPVVTRTSSTMTRSRLSLSSVVKPPSPDPPASAHVAPLLPSGPAARRRSTVAPRSVSDPTDKLSRSEPRALPNANMSTMTGSTVAVTTARPASRRISSATLPSSASMSFSMDSAGAAALCDSVGRPKTKGALHGVVACVDVRTAEGDDSGMVFVDLLKSMGARVTTRPSSVTTHIVFKSGRSTTLQFHRTLAPASRPHLVGIAWVVRCAELGARADEGPFKVEDVAAPVAGTGKENAVRDVAAATAQAALGIGSAPTKGAGDGPAGARRRKSMEPKALAALGNGYGHDVGGGEASFSGVGGAAGNAREAALKASIAASIERARRKSLLHLPKVGSPLAKRVFVMPDAPEEEDEE